MQPRQPFVAGQQVGNDRSRSSGRRHGPFDGLSDEFSRRPCRNDDSPSGCRKRTAGEGTFDERASKGRQIARPDQNSLLHASFNSVRRTTENAGCGNPVEDPWKGCGPSVRRQLFSAAHRTKDATRPDLVQLRVAFRLRVRPRSLRLTSRGRRLFVAPSSRSEPHSHQRNDQRPAVRHRTAACGRQSMARAALAARGDHSIDAVLWANARRSRTAAHPLARSSGTARQRVTRSRA